jgi:hypothetical protein
VQLQSKRCLKELGSAQEIWMVAPVDLERGQRLTRLDALKDHISAQHDLAR